ncbi:MAG: M1 family aminopeptidase [Bryobacteraceae bacterium]
MIRTPIALLLVATGAAHGAGAGKPQEIAAEMRAAGLDPAECYRVRDLHFTRGGDLRFYLTDGYLIFGKPVAGRPIAAVFSGDTEGGDAELLVLPPLRGERVSLAAFTETPNLDEHFRTGLFLFTDDTAAVLKAAIAKDEDAKKSPERGALLAEQWNPVLGNLSGSFSVRLVQHLLERVAPERGIFYSALQGVKLGNFDAIYDPDANDQIYLGQLKYRDTRAFYDTWTAFSAREFRTGARQRSPDAFTLRGYRIEAMLNSDLHLKVVTAATLSTEREPVAALPFEISEGMKVTAARVNGEECELFTADSFRANLLRRSGSVLFIVIPPRPLEPGRPAEIVFEHEGDVVRPAGRDVYFVGSRSNWYPKAGLSFAQFDIKFTYPGHLDLVFPGELKEEGKDGEYRVARRVTPAPIRLAGFNLGKYEHRTATRDGLTVEVYANRQSEFAVRAPGSEVVVLPPSQPFPRRSRSGAQPAVLPPVRYFPDPTARLSAMGDEIAGTFEFMAQKLGRPALPTLMVSPIPGAFGQGFPGLVYMSTIAYLNPAERPPMARESDKQTFFSEILHAHEVAHQWWGNVVTVNRGSDEWLMEALANYTALANLEKRKGTKALNETLGEYRERLLAKDSTEKTEESAGPLRLGTRLSSSQAPDAWHHIVYGKGSWVLHMLRARMGTESFWKFLAQVVAEHRNRSLTTEDFRATAAAYLPKGAVEPFFEHWVEGTGIPALSLTQRWRAGKLSMTVTQTGVDEDVSVQVPVTVTVRGAKPQVHWITTGSDPVTVTAPLRAAPLKVELDPDGLVLRQ